MEMKFELKSSKNLDETIVSLVENLKLEGFGVLWDFDMKSKLAEKDVILGANYRVLEVCNAEKAKLVLECNENMVYFLPCKIVVSQKDEEVRVGMIRPTALVEFMDEDPTLLELAHDVERHLKRAVMESV